MRVGLLLAVAAMIAVTASAATAPVPVKATSRNEVTPAAGSGYLAWAQSRRRHAHVYDVWAQIGTGAPFKVNAPETIAYGGGIDGTRLVYQQVSHSFQS